MVVIVTGDPTAMLDLIELEQTAFYEPLALACTGCSWKSTAEGFIEAKVRAQVHQELHSRLTPWAPGVAIGRGNDAWLLPGWRSA